MAHFTADEWDAYVKQNFSTLGEAERWRNQNNVFVDGQPAPTYTGPLSTGGFAGQPPQQTPAPAAQTGTTTMPPPTTGPLTGATTPDTDYSQTVQALLAANPNAGTFDAAASNIQQTRNQPSFATLNPADPAYAQNLQALQLQAMQQQQDAIRKKEQLAEAALTQQYNEAKGGLSAADWFKLSAAFATPVRGGFGATLANVIPALSDITSARQDLLRKYSPQLAALQQQRDADLAAAAATGIPQLLSAYKTAAEANKAPPGIKYTPDNLGGTAMVPGSGGLPNKNTRGQWVVTDPKQLALLRQMDPDGVFIAADDPTMTPRNVR